MQGAQTTRLGVHGNPSSAGSSKTSKKMVEFRITHPDKSVYLLTLPSNCTGQECLDEMCDVLGIVEKDYFGLQYIDRRVNCNIWINKRLRVNKQINSKPPYHLLFVVKFYTDVELLLQPSTIEAFYKDLKFQLHHGLTSVSDSRKALIGARIAQAEFGDIQEHNTTNNAGQTSAGGFVYPKYFPTWSEGDAFRVAKEHRKLKGVSKIDAQSLFITEVYQIDGFGMQYFPVVINSEYAILGIGARYVAILDNELTIKKRVPFYNVTQVSFGYKFFAFNYAAREEGTGSQTRKKLVFHVPNHAVSRSLFRSVTEAQVFLHQSAVSPDVYYHSDQRSKRLKQFCSKVFRMKFEKHFYYDVLRTKNESYRYYWQMLNQVQDDSTSIYEPAPASLAFINLSVNDDDGDDEDDSDSQSEEKSALIWGLSTSSSNLAKQLLPESQLRLTNSESILTYTPSPPLILNGESSGTSSISPSRVHGEASTSGVDKSSDEGDGSTTAEECQLLSENEQVQLEPLKGAQSKKFQQLLLKIQDERVCNVCMDELISSVFCPCGHYVACNRCAKKLDKCPVCRHPVAYVQCVYKI